MLSKMLRYFLRFWHYFGQKRTLDFVYLYFTLIKWGSYVLALFLKSGTDYHKTLCKYKSRYIFKFKVTIAHTKELHKICIECRIFANTAFWSVTVSVSDPVSVSSDPDPAFQAEYYSGSDPRFWWPKIEKNLIFFYRKLQLSKLQTKPSALKRDYPAMQNMRILTFF